MRWRTWPSLQPEDNRGLHVCLVRSGLLVVDIEERLAVRANGKVARMRELRTNAFEEKCLYECGCDRQLVNEQFVGLI